MRAYDATLGSRSGDLACRIALFAGLRAAAAIVCLVAVCLQIGPANATGNEEYFEPLAGAADLKAQVQQLRGAAAGFTVASFYCKPPKPPSKTQAEKQIKELKRQQRALERQANRLSHIAVEALGPTERKYQSEIADLGTALAQIAAIRQMLSEKSLALRNAPERDCSHVQSFEASNSLNAGTGNNGIGDPDEDRSEMAKQWTAQASQVRTDIEAFDTSGPYCKPPDEPNKETRRRELDRFQNLVNFYMARYERFVAGTNATRGYALRRVLYDAKSLLTSKRRILENAYEIDCSKRSSAAPLRSDSQFGYALGAMGQRNPYQATQQVGLPVLTAPQQDTLYGAQVQADFAVQDAVSAAARECPSCRTCAEAKQGQSQIGYQVGVASSSNETVNSETAYGVTQHDVMKTQSPVLNQSVTATPCQKRKMLHVK